MEPDDATAVAQARSGDEEAFRLLVERHGRTIYQLAYRMTGRSEDAEDVAQETFVRAYRQLGAFTGRSSFRTWVYRIAVNCALDVLRARPRRERNEAPDVLEHLAGASPELSSEARLYGRQVGLRVERAMQTLSGQERAAFVMRHYHGCSIEEVAAALDVRPNAAKHAVYRAVKKMRAALRTLVESPADDPADHPCEPVSAWPVRS